MIARMEKVRIALDNATAHGLNIEMLAAALAEVEEWEAEVQRLGDDVAEQALRIIDLGQKENEAVARAETAEAEADRLKAALTEHHLRRVFWKHTVDADLNTDEGCTQAAEAVVAYIAALAPADRNTT